ncbi:uncharacterized protein I206_104249 [Kwoniella pini CBS 10737]|uniref:Zn(2)-C6 fungal-type domain-containing protein n=1 Tax=Kwoniella pini CBS 10737 TaxID=1296096 RepID=A0A1B9I283_9TREE|nr:uncharacterized protein I206_04174 [Kwoniella pini CBS 10737]OCF49652.1 hypothetical protein I206_04174 [Kwoniella pini CBS 10737]
MSLNHSYDVNVTPKQEHDGPSVLLAQHEHQMPPNYLEHQPHYSQQQQMQPPLISPYEMPLGSGSSHNPNMPEYFPPLYTPTIAPLDSGSSQSTGMGDYFPATTPIPQHPQAVMSNIPLDHQNWQSTVPAPLPNSQMMNSKSNASAGPSTKAEKSGSKTSRQQFTACGACRHRRVKCDLKDKQEAAEKANEEDGIGPSRSKNSGKQKKVSCTNCIERGLNCIDEFAPLKAAKQLRRGKRISEIEMLFGKTAASAAVAHQTGEAFSDTSLSPAKGKDQLEIMPDLKREFFDSAFFMRFQVQRPLLDPHNFIGRYLGSPHPTAAAMGPEGACLCHVLYAWAVSYGVDEYGQLDVPEGGGPSLQDISLLGPGDLELKRETHRQTRREKMRSAIEVILREIDEFGIMRKPTWDGVRVLLLVLPLTDGIASPVERLSMYEAAISQVFTLCSFVAMGYDGQPSGTAGINGGSDELDGQDLALVRVRIYWYAFVHEGITTGLKGGRLHLDDEDLETMQDTINHKALVRDSAAFRISSKFATAPINLALACRKINKALTGPSAKRRTAVNGDLVKQAWEALERCWEEFDRLKSEASNTGPSFAQGEEAIRFADGWKIFLFEAQNVIRNNLEDRVNKLSEAQAQITAYITESNPSTPEALHNDLVQLQHLLDIAKSKCEVKTRQIMEIVRTHVGTRFFEWDASLVRDGTFYTAMLLARSGGSEEDIQLCIRALNELRWAHAKAWERSIDLRKEWQERAPTLSDQSQTDGTWETVLSDLAKLSSENQNSKSNLPSDAQSRSTNSSHSNHQRQSSLHQQPQQQGSIHHNSVHHHHHQISSQQHIQLHESDQHIRISTHHSEPTHSTSPKFHSPTIISPTFETAQNLHMSSVRGYVSQHEIQSTQSASVILETYNESERIILDNESNYENWLNNQNDNNPSIYNQQQNQDYQLYTTTNNNNSIPNHLGPPPLNSGTITNQMGYDGIYQNQNQNQNHIPNGTDSSNGQYVLQEDGTQIYVPYRFM